ncbi:conjugation protein [Actinobaculum suis]|uniref:Conjugation protein n=2 Tax=Actinobaculum suis TaxID=1657 RepID=A0A7Z8Y887_9ACTO|nr:DUF87 domain-containing protein [Actinobaculum suis]VDG75780.1 conjugation protein [Actinobaculum suis]
MAESGLCYLGGKRYSITLRMSDVDYQLVPGEVQENIVEKYAAFLNGHLAGQHVQITIINRVLDKDRLIRDVAISPRGDGWDQARREYNDLISARLETGRNNTVTDKFLTVSVEAESVDEAKTMLWRIAAEDAALLREVGGCKAYQLGGRERVRILQHMLRPGLVPDFDYKDLLGQNATTKDACAPWSLDHRSRADRVELSGSRSGFWRTFVLRKLPPWMSDRLLKELSEIPADLTVSLHLDPLDQSDGLLKVKRQIASMDMQRTTELRKLAKQNLTYDFIPHELQNAYDEAVALRDRLEQSNEKLFEATIVVGVAGDDSEALEEASKRVLRVASKNSCQLEVLKYMQLEGLNAILPLGVCKIPVKRNITTAIAAVMIPFTTQEIMHDTGNFYGINALSKNLIIADRTCTMNANSFILGTSGSGKSQFAKFEMEQTFLRRPHDEILIIDPEREYVPLADELQAQRVVISAGSSDTINALDLAKDVRDSESDPVRDKCSFVLALVEVLIGGTEGLSAEKRSVIDRCAQTLYREYWNTPGASAPTLASLYSILREQPEKEATEVATALELYARGSASAFAQATNVDLSSRVIVFDIADLGQDLQTFGMMVVLEEVWTRIKRNKAKGVRTWLYIDEFHLLFGNDYAAAYCQSLFKRVRKYGAAATGITQNIEELLGNERARLMLSNSDGLFLLNQQSTDADALTELLRLSAQQRGYFVNVTPGCGLMRIGDATVPFDNSMDPNSRIFKVFSTRFEEMGGQE